MHFRSGTRDDVPSIAALHTESWQTAYAGIMPDDYLNGPLLEERTALWTNRLTTGDSSFLMLAEEGTEIQGFVYVFLQPDDRLLLDNLHVQPARKRSGIGGQLMRHVFTWAGTRHPGATVYLEVLRDNAPARAFYERFGGTVTGEFMERLPAGFELPVVEYSWKP